MKKFLPFIFLLIVSIIFFYQMIFFLKVPFPGDLLVSEYSPFKYESYLGYNPGSFPSKAQYFDTLQQLYPWKIFSISSLLKGIFPLWNPYNFSGSPFFANNQSAVLNPLNAIFLILNPKVAWSIFIFMQPLLASLFTYLYLRKLKLSQVSSLFGSIAFSYSLFMSVFLEYSNIGYSFIYLPLLLYLIERVISRPLSKLRLLIPFIVGITFFSGHLQIASAVVAFSIMYFAIRCRIEKNKKVFLMLLLDYILGIGIAMIQLIPTLELAGNSARVAHNASSFKDYLLLQFQQLILFVSPDAYGNPATRNYILKDAYPGNAIYIGILPIIFVVFSFFHIKRNTYIAIFSIFSLSLLIFLTNNPISNIIYFLNISFLNSSSSSNFIFLLSFSLSVLSAYGLNIWQKKFDKRIFLAMGIIFLVTLILVTLHLFFHFEFLQKQLLIGIGLLLVSTFGVGLAYLFKKQKILYLMCFILVADLLYYFLKFNPFVPKEFVYPESPVISLLKKHTDTRVWGYSSANISPNLSTYYRILSPEGYDPLYPKWYGEFINLSRDGTILKTFDDSTRSLAEIKNGYGEIDFRDNEFRLKILNEMGVGLILNRMETPTSEYTFPSDKFSKFYDKDGWTIFHNNDAKKRVFLTNEFEIYTTKSDFEQKFKNSKVVLLDSYPKSKIVKGESSGEVKLLEEDVNKVTISVRTEANTILVLLDTYYPGWEAFVDGKKTNISRANYTFRALEVPSGEHTVIFEYKPTSFYLGLIITIISIVGTFLVFLAYELKKPKS